MTWWMQCWYVIERGMGKTEEFLAPPRNDHLVWTKRRKDAIVWRTYMEAKGFLDARKGPGVLEGARLGYIDPALAVHVQAPPVPSPPTVRAAGPDPVRPSHKRRSQYRPPQGAKAKRGAAAPKKPPRAKTKMKKRHKAK